MLRKDQKAREEAEKFDSGRDGCELFRIAKQRIGQKKDVGVSCLCKVGRWK